MKFPIYQYIKIFSLRNILISAFWIIGTIAITIWIMASFQKGKFGIFFFVSSMLIFFFLIEKILVNFNNIGTLEVTKDQIKIITPNEISIFDSTKIMAIDCYYFYTRNRFGQFHETHEVLDLCFNLRELGKTKNLLCKNKLGKSNLASILKHSSFSVNFIHMKRR